MVYKMRGGSIKSRKQIRKEKKAKRPKLKNYKHLGTNDHEVIKNGTRRKTNIAIRSTDDQLLKKQEHAINDQKKLEQQMKEERRRLLLEANEEEDKIIRSLEKKLKLNKRKSKLVPSSFVREGLDYLLELCDFDSNDTNKYRKMKIDNSGLGINTKKTFNYYIDNECENLESPFKSSEDDSEISDTNVNVEYNESRSQIKKQNYVKSNVCKKLKPNKNLNLSSKTDKNKRIKRLVELQKFVDIEEQKSKIQDDFSESSDLSSMDGDRCSQHIATLPESDAVHDIDTTSEHWEDIYGRMRDKEGNVIKNSVGVYIPPHKKECLWKENEKMRPHMNHLLKQMKGLFNRLTENNMHSISHQVEDLYMLYSHNDLNETLVRLLVTSLISTVSSAERIVTEHAMLIALLHANVGSELGAFVLQNFVEKFMKMSNENPPVENKEIDNVLLFVAQLYNFKVFHSCLLYGILEKLSDRFIEKNVELILLILRTVGLGLRKDDPSSLKGLILKLQTMAQESSHLQQSARVGFMLDTLLAIKNNNVAKIPQYDPSHVEHLKKITKPMLRPGKFITQLKITLDDITNVEARGKWWIVGSAWKDCSQFKANEGTAEGNNATAFSTQMLKLAKKQRMNTDARRNIFCVIMSAENYTDAFEKLMRLGFKDSQHREIIHVLVHCFLQEKNFNAYYVCLAEYLCSVNRMYQLALQFAMWDRFKEIDSLSSAQIMKIAKFLSYLIIEGMLSLSILKVIEFAEVNKPLVKLLRTILIDILLCDSEEKVIKVFVRISKSPTLCTLRQSLQLFAHHFILKNIEEDKEEMDQSRLSMLPFRIQLAENVMLNGVPLDFD